MNGTDDNPQEQKPKRNKLGIVLVIFAFLGILVAVRLVWPEFPFPRQRRFTECDPHKLMNLIKENFDITLPNNISSAKAAETKRTFPEQRYIFILNFTTDLNGWEQFETWFMKTRDHKDHDMHEYLFSSDDPRAHYNLGTPKWHKAKIREGIYYYGFLKSKDHHLQINLICVDLADAKKVIFYIEGQGSYDSSYVLD